MIRGEGDGTLILFPNSTIMMMVTELNRTQEKLKKKINDFIISRSKERKLSSTNVGCNEMQNGTEN